MGGNEGIGYISYNFKTSKGICNGGNNIHLKEVIQANKTFSEYYFAEINVYAYW